MTVRSYVKKILASAGESQLLSRLFDKQRRGYVPIFMLHRFKDTANGVEGHSGELLRACLAWLRSNNYSVISLNELVDALDRKRPLMSRAVAFTMDDGFTEQVDIAAKIFEEFSYPVTIFLISEFSYQRMWPWDYQVEYIFNKTTQDVLEFEVDEEKFRFEINGNADYRARATQQLQEKLKCLSTNSAIAETRRLAALAGVSLDDDSPATHYPVTWEKARSAESRLVSFGPHSQRHAILKQQSDRTSRDEIAGSKASLEAELINPLNIFCYPTGRKNVDFGQREMDTVKELGMRAAVSVTPGYVSLKEHARDEYRYCLPRIGFPDNLIDFIQVCSWVELAKEKVRGNL